MQSALEIWLAGEVYGALLVFCRVGAAVMVLPGLGESFVPPRVRLILAFAVSWPIAIITPGLPAVPPGDAGTLAEHVGAELFAGLLLGVGARILFSAARIAAQIAGQSMALSNIFAAPGTGMDAGSVLTTWFTIGALAFWFASGLHLIAIDALARSYVAIPPGAWPDLAGTAEAVAAHVAKAFALGAQLGAPFFLLGFIAYFALGLVNRLMASLPVFFIAMPAGILAGIWLLVAVIGSVLTVLGASLQTWLEAPYG